MAHRDRPPARGRIGEELGQRIRKGEPAVLHLQHHRGRGELLPQRSRLEHRLGRDCDVVLEIRDAVALRFQYLPVLNHRDADARQVLALHLFIDEPVDPVAQRVLGARGRRGQQQKQH
jgi:hypothetical protein